MTSDCVITPPSSCENANPSGIWCFERKYWDLNRKFPNLFSVCVFLWFLWVSWNNLTRAKKRKNSNLKNIFIMIEKLRKFQNFIQFSSFCRDKLLLRYLRFNSISRFSTEWDLLVPPVPKTRLTLLRTKRRAVSVSLSVILKVNIAVFMEQIRYF